MTDITYSPVQASFACRTLVNAGVFSSSTNAFTSIVRSMREGVKKAVSLGRSVSPGMGYCVLVTKETDTYYAMIYLDPSAGEACSDDLISLNDREPF